jgi:hypothetical protein
MKSQREGDSPKSWASPDKTGNRLSFGTESLKIKNYQTLWVIKLHRQKKKYF